MTAQLTSLLNQHKPALVDALLATPVAQRLQVPAEDQRRATLLASLDGLIGLIQQPQPVLAATLGQMVQSQLRAGVARDDALDLLDAQRAAIYQLIGQVDLPAAEALQAVRRVEEIAHLSARATVDAYHAELLERLSAASAAEARLREAIQQLSTPIIPVYNGVLVVPLIGQVDSMRAQALTEALLEAIAREQAELVLLDITGVAVVDTSVANHLMQTARAAGLLGSQVVLVGISAEIAQTLVQLGLDLGHLVTLSNLQSGLEYALAQQGLAITARA